MDNGGTGRYVQIYMNSSCLPTDAAELSARVTVEKTIRRVKLVLPTMGGGFFFAYLSLRGREKRGLLFFRKKG